MNRRVRVHLIGGTRPNFVKIAPLWKALANEEWCEPIVVHTGQHFDINMSDWMFRDLGLPSPHFHLAAQTGSHARVTGSVMIAYEKLCQEVSPPDWVVVVGDVDSTLACAIAAKKLGLRVAHLEAGLRSFDRTMPEEINRIMTDSIADLLWTPSVDGDENLRREGVPAERVERVGNVMIDALVAVQDQVEQVSLAEEFQLDLAKRYGVITLHRPSNVDHPEVLAHIVDALVKVASEIDLVFPVHPRTRKALEHVNAIANLKRAGVRLHPPLAYIPFIALVRKAAFLLTDSGGIQEETSFLGIPCLTLRESTERPVTVSRGTNRLVTLGSVPQAVRDAMARSASPCAIPLWDGNTAHRVAASLKQRAVTII
jgi:UDP-N-acetylglucosamine 2-epimerase (non-hydrolysing)